MPGRQGLVFGRLTSRAISAGKRCAIIGLIAYLLPAEIALLITPPEIRP